MKKKLLIYAHYYIPDAASTGQILSELAEGLKTQFDITVICVVPSYLGNIEDKYKRKKYYYEMINGIKVIRVRVKDFDKLNRKSRVKNILSYFFLAMKATFKTGHQDYIFSISQPPILGGLLGVWGKFIKRAKFIYNIQDFNPEQTKVVRYSTNKFVTNSMMWFDKFSCRHSDLVITVGRDLLETHNNRFPNEKRRPKAVFINNWIDEKKITPLKDNKIVDGFKDKYELNGKFIIMYSGNIGLYYDLKNIFKIIKKIKPGTKTNDGREVAFVFVGAGTLHDELVDYKNENDMKNVYFIPYQPKEELVYSLNAADVHWCINAKGIKGVSCPSKYYGLAAVGKPVLGVLEKGSEIRCLIEDTNGGLVCDPEDYESIENNLRWFINNSDSYELIEMGRRGRVNLEKNLTKDISIKKYSESILGC